MENRGFINRPMSIALDAVRVLAAFAVLLGHGAQHGLYRGPWPFTTMFQHNAVVVFFVLSGLVIANSAFRRNAGLRDYVLARATRIMPTAIFAVLFSALAFALSNALDLGIREEFAIYQDPSMGSVILPLLFLNESVIGTGPLWNPPFWSLAYEVWFYAIFGAAFFLRGRERVLAVALVCLIAGLKIVLLLPVWLIGLALARYAPARNVNAVLAAVLMLGGLFLMAWTSDAAQLSGRAFRAFSGLSFEQVMFSNYVLTDIVLGVGIAMIFVGMRPLAMLCSGLLERAAPVITYFANCSFSIYLLHWPIMNLLQGFGVTGGTSVLSFFVLLAGIVAFCAFVARFTEHKRKPVRAYLDMRFGTKPVLA